MFYTNPSRSAWQAGVHFLVNPSYENNQGQSFFLDQAGRFIGQRQC
jgi:hypothetical protein